MAAVSQSETLLQWRSVYNSDHQRGWKLPINMRQWMSHVHTRFQTPTEGGVSLSSTCSPARHTLTCASRNSTTTFSLLQRAAIFLLLPSTKCHVIVMTTRCCVQSLWETTPKTVDSPEKRKISVLLSILWNDWGQILQTFWSKHLRRKISFFETLPLKNIYTKHTESE